jgi:hypothetical protein
MKIRTGFVSNSSTSSFCIYGICIEGTSASELATMFNLKHDFYDEDEDDEDSNYDVQEQINEKCEKVGLCFNNVDDTIYIGREWCSIEDDETGKQFKEKTEEIIKKQVNIDVKCDTIEIAYPD